MSDTYTCAKCGGVFGKGWTDEEAMAEHNENFPGESLSDCAVICDDCYNKLMKSLWGNK
jgi:hypothetical protein